VRFPRRNSSLSMASFLKPIEWVLGNFSVDMGIDLGTANTLVCARGRGIILNEPSVVAVKKGTNEVLLDGMAVGNAAKAMLGKTPGNIEAIRPLRHGVIADFEVTEKMLRYFISRVHDGKSWVKPQVVISVPTGITDVERRAVVHSAERAGARRVFLIDEPMAAGIGIELPVTEAHGSLIVDIGGGTTEVAVLARAGSVVATSQRVAGADFDEAIANHMRRFHTLLIGEQTAERIKLTIGSAWPMEQELSMEVKGRDSIQGLPRRTTVTSIEVREALAHPVRLICEAIRGILEEAPPEISADLVDTGVTIVGGGALLYGVSQAISDHLGVPSRVADDPLTAVARGTGIFLDKLDVFSRVLATGDDER
jgi:rod shape-determining protein MreB